MNKNSLLFLAFLAITPHHSQAESGFAYYRRLIANTLANQFHKLWNSSRATKAKTGIVVIAGIGALAYLNKSKLREKMIDWQLNRIDEKIGNLEKVQQTVNIDIFFERIKELYDLIHPLYNKALTQKQKNRFNALDERFDQLDHYSKDREQ